jgi:hypothetical protein
LGLEVADTYDDVVLHGVAERRLAGLDMVVDYPIVGAGVATFTDDLRNAVFLQSQRLAARRNSPEGRGGPVGDRRRLRVRRGSRRTTPTCCGRSART